jgi:pyruvate,orthophosphate dikinase
MGVPVEKIKQRVKELHEFNPMLGFRGCRLGIVYPEISEMQARAVFEAAAEVQKAGIKVKPEVMIPLVGFKKELDLQVEVVHRVAKEVMAEKKVKLTYMVGTMIEVPRGALTADEIAQTAEFFSFGTNDLTQTCLGMSRDDSGSFLGAYQELEIIKKNPFASIDQTGVGQLMKIAVEKGNKTRPWHQARHLRRTRRRPRLREVLPQARPDLRELLAVPRAGGAPGRRPGRVRSFRHAGCSCTHSQKYSQHVGQPS